MRIRLDPYSSVPPSTQLRERLGAEIEQGRLLPGDRVPPVRALAAELGLAPNTVAKAYRELEAADLLVGRGRHGTYVSERLPRRPSDAELELDRAADAFARRARQIGASADEALRAARRALGR